MEKALPAIPAKRYFTIGEVSDLCGVKPYVLRYERAWLELQLSTHTGSSLSGEAQAVRELTFGFDPTPLFEALGAGNPVPDWLPESLTTVVLDFRSDPPQTLIRPASNGRVD